MQLELTSERKLALVSFNWSAEMTELIEFDLTGLPEFEQQISHTFQCSYANELYRICVIPQQREKIEQVDKEFL